MSTVSTMQVCQSLDIPKEYLNECANDSRVKYVINRVSKSCNSSPHEAEETVQCIATEVRSHFSSIAVLLPANSQYFRWGIASHLVYDINDDDPFDPQLISW